MNFLIRFVASQSLAIFFGCLQLGWLQLVVGRRVFRGDGGWSRFRRRVGRDGGGNGFFEGGDRVFLNDILIPGVGGRSPRACVERVRVLHGNELGQVEEQVEEHLGLAAPHDLNERQRYVLMNVSHLLHDVVKADKVLMIEERQGPLPLCLLLVEILDVVGGYDSVAVPVGDLKPISPSLLARLVLFGEDEPHELHKVHLVVRPPSLPRKRLGRGRRCFYCVEDGSLEKLEDPAQAPRR